MAVDMWSFRATTIADADLSGFRVEALDGEIGKVDAATYRGDDDAIVVDTGPLVFGRKVILPVGTIERVDPETKTIYVDRTKDEIKDAPEFDPSGYADQEYRIALSQYYARLYA